jgi:hypothetical protein
VHHTKDFYDGHNPRVQRFMEIYSMWGDYEALAFDILNRGARIGLTGGGDCHEGRCGFSVEDARGQGVTPHTFAPGLKHRCGMTAALLPSLTRQELLQALRQGKTYATTGARILLDFSISGLPMGEEGTVDRDPRVCAQIHACGPLKAVEVVKNGVVVYSLQDQPQDCVLTWTDTSGEGGWYLVRVVQKDGQKAWSSPIWVRTDG